MLSIIIITLNEEDKIRDCLESVKWGDEIIVVDCFSQDNTVRIAEEYTDKVYKREFTGFGEQKNFALSKATGDWVLSIDADERVTPELREEIKKTLAEPQACGYKMPVKTYFSGRWIKHCGWWPNYKLRLFRRDSGRFSDRLVHEAIEVNGPIAKLRNPLEHRRCSSISSSIKKADRYSTLGAQVMVAEGKNYTCGSALTHSTFTFFKVYFLKLGILDGWRGFVIASLNAIGVFYKYIKCVELQGGTELTPTIAVMVSTYNAPEYLAKVLEGYLVQTRPPDELIVADDGSDQHTAETVSAFASKAKFPIRHVWQEDRGFRVAKVRNEGFKASSADYIIITDGHSVPHPCFVEDHIKAMQPGYFVQGKRMLVSERAAGPFTNPGLRKCIKMCIKGELTGCHHLLRVPGFTVRNRGLRGIKTCNLALYRKDFLAVNGLNEDFVGWGREDSELAVRLFKYGLKRKDTPFSAIVFHLWHEPGSSEFLDRNDMLLEETIRSSDCYCKNGIYKQPR